MRTFTITSLMSSLQFTAQLMLHLLCPLSPVINVALPSLCTAGKAEFGALWHNSFKATKELLPPLCDCPDCKFPAEPALGDLQLYNLPRASKPSGKLSAPPQFPQIPGAAPEAASAASTLPGCSCFVSQGAYSAAEFPSSFFLTKSQSTVGWTLLQSYRSQTPSTAVSWQKPLQGFPSTPNVCSGSYWHKGPLWCYITLYLQCSTLSRRRNGKETRAVASSPEYLGFWVWPGDFVHLLWL